MHHLNIVPSKSVPKTPMQLWSRCKPSMRYLYIWGCPAHVLKGKPDKLEPKSEVCLFIVYPKETRGYLFYSYIDNKVFVSNAKFLDNDYMNNYTPRSRVVLPKMTELVIEQSIDETRNDVVVSYTPQGTTHEMTSALDPHCSGRSIRPPVRFTLLGETFEAILKGLESYPYIFEEAMKDIDAHHWLKL